VSGREPDPAWLAVEPVAPPAERDLPQVAVVVLTWNGRGHLAGCFDSLAATEYPPERRAVVLVDNGSDDGSSELVRARYPWVRLAVNARNVGFSAGCNQGARLAPEADVLVFLNNDMRVEPGFLRWLVAPIVAGVAVATTAKMLSWDGSRLDSAGGGMNFHGIGIQRGFRHAPDERYDRPRRSLFACGGAMAMQRAAFERLGGFDEEFFAYYEDVDLGWRTWIAGHEVHYVPGAVSYHHHSSTSARVPAQRLRVLQVRNPLLACFKNYDDANWARVFPAMLALAARRAYLATGLGEAGEFRIERLERLGSPSWTGRLRRRRGRVAVDPLALADLVAINDLIGQWDHWTARRAQVQATRARPDAEILPLFLDPLWCVEQDHGYVELQRGVTQAFGLRDLFQDLTTLEEEPY